MLLFVSLLIILSLAIRALKRRSFLSASCYSFALVILILASHLLSMMQTDPDVKVVLTGKTRQEGVEWKPLQAPLQKETLTFYEVRIENLQGELLGDFFLAGDQAAVKAKAILFSPFLNAIGVKNLCQLEMVHAGYSSAKRHSFYPQQAHEIIESNPLKRWAWKIWSSLYLLETSLFFVKGALLESHFFPLMSREGKPLASSYLLTLSSHGISSEPCTQ
jgi:hypothetical protein